MASRREGGFKASIFAVCVAFAAASVINIQVEDFAKDSNIDSKRVFPRSEAGNKRTVWLFSGECISVRVCLLEDDIVTISNVKFSNDGESDIVVVDIDENVIGSFNSSYETSFGSYWNIFEDTGPIGRPVSLPAGSHVLTLTVVEADDYGVELDEISIVFDGNYRLDDILCPGNIASKCLQRSSTTIDKSSGGLVESENEYSTTPKHQDCTNNCDTTDPAANTDKSGICNGFDCGDKNEDGNGSNCEGSDCDDKGHGSTDNNGDVDGGRGSTGRSYNSGQQSNCDGNGCTNSNSEVTGGSGNGGHGSGTGRDTENNGNWGGTENNGSDSRMGNNGNDSGTGNNGNGRGTGNNGNDSGTGNNGSDSRIGNNGNGRGTGNNGNDSGTGNNGSDSRIGNSGNDSGIGNNGNDSGTGNNGSDSRIGNSGNDSGIENNVNDSGTGNNGSDSRIGNSGNDSGIGNNVNDSGTGNNGSDSRIGNSGNDSGIGNNGNGRGAGNNDNERDTGSSDNNGGTGSNGKGRSTGNIGNDRDSKNNGNDRDTVNNNNERPAGNSDNTTLSSVGGGDSAARKNRSADNISGLDVPATGTDDLRNITTYDESYLFECPQRQIITMIRYSQLQCSNGMTRFDIFASDVTEIIMSIWKSSKDQDKHRTRRSVSEGDQKHVGDPMEVYSVWESGERERSCETVDDVLEEDVIIINGNEKNKMFPVIVDPANTRYLTLTFNVNSTMQETIFGRSFSSIFTVGIRCMDKPAYISARFTDPETNKSVELSPKRFTNSVTWQTWTFPFLVAGSGNFDMTLNFTNASEPFGLHFLRLDLQETFGSLLPLAFINPTFGFGGNIVNLAKSDTTSLDGVEERQGPKMRVRMRGSGRKKEMTSLILSSTEDGSAQMLPKFIFNQNGSALFYPDQSPDAQPVFVMGNDDSNGLSPFPVMDISRVDIAFNNSAYELNIMTRSFRRATVLVSIEGNKTTVNLKTSPSVADQHSPLCSLMLPCWGVGYGKTAIISADGTRTISMFSPWKSFKGHKIEMQRSQNVTDDQS
ncbi:uncharacterized protein [Haliotis asinina]|uniref:uncharacterized protein n=1 Tax=Haliotis asinina TaxID=109174 RepID=UPI003531B268